VSARAEARRHEHELLGVAWRDGLVLVVVATLTVILFVAMAVASVKARIQHVDDAFLRWMIDVRAAPLTDLAKGFNYLGLVYVTLPVRLLLAGLLVWWRRWFHLAAFASAIIVSEAGVGILKSLYGRMRPPGSLVPTTGASFPSGHAIAITVTAVAAVLAFVPPGRRRGWAMVAAAIFSGLMGLSRAYLAAHWLSDAIAGVLFGVSVALGTAVVVHLVRNRAQARTTGSGGAPHQVRADR
jgi:undecaprenyl-diphosphatase